MQQDLRTRHLGLFVVLALLLAAGTLFQDLRFDRSLVVNRATAAALDRQCGSIEVALSDLRAAQAGYLATGQGPDFWMRRASDLFAQLESSLTTLRDGSTNGEARAHYESSLAALAGLSGIDKRAREQIQAEQPFLAADLIFVDSVDGSQRIRTELTAARDAEALAASTRMARTSQWRLGLSALALAGVFGLALFASRPARQAASSPAAATAQMLRDLPPPVKPATTAPRVGAVPAPPPAPAPTVSLPDAAELCVDLARVMDSRDVPALLERAATVLDAKGVIIWILDADGSVLRPSLTHGYSSRVLAKMGALDVAADNVTSLCFRSMRPQTMPAATPGSAGAVAVPLMTASGCSGVLAAETRESRPAPEAIAVARIIAAQFATFIVPNDAGRARAVQA